MSERPDGLLDSAVLLFRRIAPDAMDKVHNRPLHTGFRLRPSRGEQSLSFYDASNVSAEQVLVDAPGPGWAVVRTTVGQLRELGFEVVTAPTSGGGLLGQAHVSAIPAEVHDGQIPATVRQSLAFACTTVTNH